MKAVSFSFTLLAALALAGAASGEAITASHTCVTEFDEITSSVISQIQADYRILYGHSSHGGQVMTGLDMLYAENTLYSQPDCHEISDDLGGTGDVSWVPPTRDYLDANPTCNVVMWSWCGGVSDITEEGINIYLDAMNQLEIDYPGVTFIYMTGHLDGTGIDGNLYERNNQIRSYCETNDKVLFDFADIESYDPDGNYYPDGTDACEWCYTWCATYTCPTCVDCAHSHCFNCYQKGKAFWWMTARMTGWTSSTDINQPTPDELPVSIELGQNHPNPFNPATTIEFTLNRRSNVSIAVYNLLGERIRVLVEGVRPVGLHRVTWDGTDSRGDDVASGIYLYRLTADGYETSKKMMFLK